MGEIANGQVRLSRHRRRRPRGERKTGASRSPESLKPKLRDYQERIKKTSRPPRHGHGGKGDKFDELPDADPAERLKTMDLEGIT